MTARLPRWSLATRMAAMFSGLLAVIGVFILAFFPARMARQAQHDAEERAAAVAQVMSTALGPAVEFDDPENAATILDWLATTRDARFGMVRRADGTVMAVWRPHALLDAKHVWPSAHEVTTVGELLMASMPIQALGGTQGTVHLGFSLLHLEEERDEMRRTVALVTGVMFALGLVATVLFARVAVRPIRTLTTTALKISRGELSADLPVVSGDPEVARLAAALRQMLKRIDEESQQELLRASRAAGMAEVATGVLHNVGNVLTSVNVSVELLRERVAKLPVDRLRKLHELLSTTSELSAEKLASALKYVGIVADAFETSRADSLKELGTLGGHVDHIKRVVAMQNAYARVRSVVEPTRIDQLLDEALEIGCPPAKRASLTLFVDVAPALAEAVPIDRHRVLQIVVNLISNARDALFATSGPRRLQVRALREGDTLVIAVTDSGVGISGELLTRIFSAGFTSKPQGHGYGLHSSALAAKQLGGALVATSDGEGRGATFTLTIPIGEAP